ncbi:MAG: uroporphyrinogen-III synthase, partial [Clostridiales bacterium]
MLKKKIVITRPAGLASALSEKITALGGEAVEFPCIQTKARSDKELSAIVPLIDDYNWLVFTSVAGVETVFAALARLGYAGELFQGKSFAVIGSGTAHALRARGFEAD